MAFIEHKTHPNFLAGLLSYLLFLVGVFLRYNNLSLGTTLIGIAIGIGAVHWVVAIIDVSTNSDLKKDGQSWYLWVALIIMLPPVAGMLYYMVHKRKVRL
ncbi:MAG TPA: hypothetical protein VEB42_05215 [Chitinophagaceae bacterium]|nr:hypothetical protein [Chitinophagaceae bacterium]